MDWGRNWLVDFNAGETQLVSFHWSNSTGAIDVKMDGSVLEENLSFKMLGLTFSSKLDWSSRGSYFYCQLLTYISLSKLLELFILCRFVNEK